MTSNTPQSGRFFLPGPTEVHPDVLAAQNAPMIGHRGPAITGLMERIGDGLKKVFLTERPVIVSTSSATGLMEAAIRNGVTEGPVLSLVNGAFSLRFSEIARTCGFDVDIWEVTWGDVHSADELSERLAKRRYEAVTLSHSETSTGALQDLQAIAEVVRKNDDTLLLVDSVTGVPGVETHADEWGVDFILTGSQKAMALPPGLAFGVASDAMMNRAATAPRRGWYFALDRLMDQLINHQTPATPAISLLYALDVQLGRIALEGLDARWARHLAMRDRTLAWIDEMAAAGVGIGAFAVEGCGSPTVTTISMPDDVPGSNVVSELRSRGWVIGAGYGKIKDSTIRIGHMGDHTVEELEPLLQELADVLQ